MAGIARRSSVSRKIETRWSSVPANRHSGLRRLRDAWLKESWPLRHAVGLPTERRPEESGPGSRVLVATWLWWGATRGEVNALVCARAHAGRLGFPYGIKG